jgi:predicted permease
MFEPMRLRLRTDRLAAILASSRLSQNHWALRLGLSRGHWSDIVNGRHPFPSAKTRQRMIEVFDVAESELFAEEESRGDEIALRLALAPRYELLRELGQGAMGTVYLATDRPLGRMVSIKVVAPEAAAGVGTRALLTEIAFVARLQHPNILPLFEAGELADHPYYVMPYVREGSLRAMLHRRGRIGVAESLELVSGMARGLSHAHEQQVLHCDVKPENVLVQDGHCFVMDFGIARKLRSEAREWRDVRKELDFSAGTPAYVSPEQASGDRDVDQRSDIYSLACVAFEVISGQIPFGGRSTQEIVSRRFHEPPAFHALPRDVPDAVVQVLQQAMSIDPAHRPATAREFAQELHNAVVTTRPVRASNVILSRGSPPSGGQMKDLHSRGRGPSLWPMRLFRFVQDDTMTDLRYAFRSLSQSWRFALGVVFTLGLGIGLGAPVLNLADHFFLRTPPGVTDADRILRLIKRTPGTNGPILTDGQTGLDYAVMTTRARTVESVAGYVNMQRSLGRGANARTIPVTLASASYFSVLGVRPYMGRFYLESEDIDGATEAPCVVSYRFWQTQLEGAKDVIGRSLVIGEIRYTIVGVAPDGFTGLTFGPTDAWLPLRAATPEAQGRFPQLWTTDQSAWLRIIVKMKPGVSLAQVTAEAVLLYRTSGERTRDRELAGTFMWDPLQPGRSSSGNRFATISLWLSAGGVLLLILIAANLINLFIARGAARARQTAVRLAIGGSWRHLLRLQLLESAVLGVAAAVVGLVIAIPTVRISRTLLFPGTAWDRPIFDARIAVVAFGIAFGIGAVVALWSTMHALRADPMDLLRGAGTTQMSGSRRANALRRTLLIVQAAVFVVLLTGASAFVLSLRRATRVDYGFDVDRVMAGRISLPAETPRAVQRDLMFRAYERALAMPGVQSASLGYMEPWNRNASQPISVPGSTVEPPWTMFDFATPEYLRTFGVQMKQGRWIEASDGPNAAPVVVINEALEKVFWPAGGAVGKCMRVGADSMPCRTIVGVVSNFQVTGTMDDAMRPVYYLAFAQSSGFSQAPTLFIRTQGDRGAVTRAALAMLQSLQANLPAANVHPLSDNIALFTSPYRLGAAAFTTFGVVAAIVGALGLYSVLAFLIIEQRRAHAIRLAIGASPNVLAKLVVRFAVTTVAIGMIAGYVALVPLSRVFGGLLYHTRALEPMVILVVVMLGTLTAVVAAIVPASAVMRTDVMTVLREQ